MERRLTFSNWLCQQNSEFFKNIIWTDECTFTNLGIFNRHNEHYWPTENLRVHCAAMPQQRFGINLWVGLWKNKVIGPFIFEDSLTAER